MIPERRYIGVYASHDSEELLDELHLPESRVTLPLKLRAVRFSHFSPHVSPFHPPFSPFALTFPFVLLIFLGFRFQITTGSRREHLLPRVLELRLPRAARGRHVTQVPCHDLSYCLLRVIWNTDVLTDQLCAQPG